MTDKLRGVRVDEYAYCVNKPRQNAGLETCIWLEIVTSQTAHTKYKWPPYATEWNPPHENFPRTLLQMVYGTFGPVGRRAFGGTTHQNYFCSSQTLSHISINSMIIIIPSLNSILPLLVSMSLAQHYRASASLQRNIEYILDLNRTMLFSRLVFTKL